MHVMYGDPSVRESATRYPAVPIETAATLARSLFFVMKSGWIIAMSVNVKRRDWMEAETIVAAVLSPASFAPDIFSQSGTDRIK